MKGFSASNAAFRTVSAAKRGVSTLFSGFSRFAARFQAQRREASASFS